MKQLNKLQFFLNLMKTTPQPPPPPPTSYNYYKVVKAISGTDIYQLVKGQYFNLSMMSSMAS